MKQLFTKEENLKNTVAWVHLALWQQGSSDRYFQDVEDDIKKFVPEGIEGRVAYKGSLREVVHQYTGGLRAGMGYCGAKDIADSAEGHVCKNHQCGYERKSCT